MHGPSTSSSTKRRNGGPEPGEAGVHGRIPGINPELPDPISCGKSRGEFQSHPIPPEWDGSCTIRNIQDREAEEQDHVGKGDQLPDTRAVFENVGTSSYAWPPPLLGEIPSSVQQFV